MDPQVMVAGIGLSPSRSWAVGELRSTPKGSRLPGTYQESYCSFNLGDRDDGELAAFLNETLDALEPSASFISELRKTDGMINFYISWSVGQRGEVFDTKLLARMARLGIDLGIEPF